MNPDTDYKRSIAAIQKDTARIRDTRNDFTALMSELKRQDAELLKEDRIQRHAGELLEALKRLAYDVQDYPAWERPCLAVDAALALIAKCEGLGEE